MKSIIVVVLFAMTGCASVQKPVVYEYPPPPKNCEEWDRFYHNMNVKCNEILIRSMQPMVKQVEDVNPFLTTGVYGTVPYPTDVPSVERRQEMEKGIEILEDEIHKQESDNPYKE